MKRTKARLLSIATFLAVILLSVSNSYAQGFGPEMLIKNSETNKKEFRVFDYDGDGNNDIITAQLAWYPNDGTQLLLPVQLMEPADHFVVGLINEDSYPDFVVSRGGGIYFYPGTEDPEVLGEPLLISTIWEISKIVLGDENGDGQTDILVFHAAANRFVWFQSDWETMTFSPIEIEQMDYDAVEFHLADFNNDGNQEILSVFRYGIHLIEKVDGNWGIELIQGAAPSEYLSLEVADVDNNGWVDIIYATEDEGLFLKKNEGGDFQSSPTALHHQGVDQIIAVDVDGDNDQDLVTYYRNFQSRRFSVLENTDGLGVFGAPKEIDRSEREVHFWRMGDLDGNGKPELIGKSSKMLWKINNFGWIASQPARYSLFSEKNEVSKLIAHDFDGDNVDELVVQVEDEVLFFKVDPGNNLYDLKQRFSRLIYTNFLGTGILSDLVDVNSDGYKDLVFKNGDNLYWSKYLEAGGIFNNIQLLFADFPGFKFYFTDWNEDGLTDAVQLSPEGVFNVLFSDEEMNYNLAFSLDAQFYLNNLQMVFLEDINGDGFHDILFRYYQENSWHIRCFINNQDNTFNEIDCITPENRPVSPIDFDQDGDIDLLLTLNSNPGIQIIRFDQTEQCFLPVQVLYDQLPMPINIANVSDIDGDGDFDVTGLSQSNSPYQLWTLETTEAGYTPYQIFDSTQILDAITFNDFNSDQYSDLFYLSGNRVYVHRGKDSPFEYNMREQVSLPTLIAQSLWIDVDTDGIDDLLSFTEMGLEVFPRTTGRTILNHAQPVSDGIFPFQSLDGSPQLVALDYENDGDMDVILREWSTGNKLYLLLNDAGVFSPHLIKEWATTTFANTFVTDIDNDGFEDIVLDLKYTGNLRRLLWFKNNQEPTSYFDPQTIIADIPYNNFSNNALDLAFDLDRDGDQDMVGLDSDNNIRWFENLADSFAMVEKLRPDLNVNTDLTAADLNGDSFDDLLTCMVYNGIRQFVWFANDPDSLISEPNVISSICGLEPIPVDYDQDGDMDIVARNLLFLNKDVQGGYFEVIDLGITNSPDYYQHVFDFDFDGQVDILSMDLVEVGNPEQFSHSNFEQIDAYSSTDRYHQLVDIDLDGIKDFLIDNGNGIFWAKGVLDGEGVAFEEIHFITGVDAESHFFYRFEDLNQDGLRDIVISSPAGSGKNIRWYPAEDPGFFSSAIIIAPVNNHENHDLSIEVADIDGDGKNDVLAYSKKNNQFLWYKHLDGNGQFASSSPLVDIAIQRYILRDLDGDGDMDILATNATTLYFLENDGTGAFGAPLSLQEGVNVKKLESLDFDQDLDLDIIYHDISSGQLLMMNQESGEFSTTDTLALLSDLGDFWIEDINADFLPDLVLYRNDTIFWRQGFSGQQLMDEVPLFFEPMLSNVRWGDVENDFDNDIFYSKERDVFWRQNLANNPLIRSGYFLDENANGELDTGETFLSNFSLSLMPTSIRSFSDEDGITDFYVSPGQYNLASIPIELWQLSSDSSSYQVQAENEVAIDRYFGLTPAIDTSIIDIHVASAPTRCGFEVPFWINAVNEGTHIENGTLIMVVDSLSEYLEASPLADQEMGDTLMWNIEDWRPTEAFGVQMVLKMPSAEYLGEFLNYGLMVQLENDSTFQERYTSEIRCSYDPNDKLVSPDRGEDHYVIYDEELTYTIRFQNTGTDTAFNITITDQLDEKLDWNTFRPVASSHSYDVSLSETGMLTFNFRDILLPDSTTNEPESHGFIQYVIQTKVWDVEYEKITNTASIFFDYNNPIITNTVENILLETLPISTETENVSQQDLEIRVFPNPFKDEFNLDIHISNQSFQELQLELYDSFGRLIYNQELASGVNAIYTNKIASGVYFYRVTGWSSEDVHFQRTGKVFRW